MELSQNKLKHLEDSIREIICKSTDSIYVSYLRVIYEDGIYRLQLGLNGREAIKMSLGFQGDELEFIKYIESEFRKRIPQTVISATTTLINGDGGIHYPVIEI